MKGSRTHRRGLAMFELTIALPLLLLIMALMINYGSVACWKVRTLMTANYTISGVRYPRNADTLPRPDYWPLPGGTYGTGGWFASGADVSSLDQPMVRGPLFDLNLGPDRVLPVRASLLDPRRGFGEGHAELTRSFAMVARLGLYHLLAHHDLLDNLWQYRRTGLGSNVTRRMPVLYTLPQTPTSFRDTYVTAVWDILSSPWLADLLVLERDPRFPGLPGNLCSANRQVVDDIVAQYLLNPSYARSIPRVPERLEAQFAVGASSAQQLKP